MGVFSDLDNILFSFKEKTTKKTKWLMLLRILCYGGISASSDFVSRNKDTYLTFILNCRSDYLVAYPQKEQKTYKTKVSCMKMIFDY